MQSDKPIFFPIGRPDNPRWLAPQGYRPREEAFAGWRPYRLASRLAWAAIKPAMRWGAAPPALPDDHAYVRCIAGLDWRTLGWRRAAEPVPLVYVGTPGPRRKAVVHLIDPVSHACELIVKVPFTEAAKWAIRHEAQTLLHLRQEEFAAAPRLVELDDNNGIAAQTVMAGSHSGLNYSREVAMLLLALERPGDRTTLSHIASSLESRSRGPDMNQADSALLARALGEIDDSSGMPAVRIHGDFAPWNIKLQNGTAALVDWEDSQPRGLPLHDACHFAHMTRCLFGKRPRPVWRELRFRYDFPLTASQRRKLELAYLVQILLREFLDPAYATYLLATLRNAVVEQL